MVESEFSMDPSCPVQAASVMLWKIFYIQSFSTQWALFKAQRLPEYCC